MHNRGGVITINARLAASETLFKSKEATLQMYAKSIKAMAETEQRKNEVGKLFSQLIDGSITVAQWLEMMALMFNAPTPPDWYVVANWCMCVCAGVRAF